MKIGIDCRMYRSNFTGIGRYTYELVQHFIEFNKNLKNPHQLILFFNHPEYENSKTSENVKKILVNSPHYSFSEQTKFLKILNKENLDIIHFPHFNVPIFYKKPFIATIHDLTLTLFNGRKMTKFHHRLAYNLTIKNTVKKAKTIIAVSENTKKDIQKHLKTHPDKIKVIYNGVNENFKKIQDQAQIQKTLQKYNINKKFLLYTGVWRNHKNIPRLIKAFNILKNEKNLDLQLVITGKPDPYYPEVKETVKNLKLGKSIIFTGMVSEKELIELYSEAKIYVFPSLYEGFGLPPLEAMKTQTPVAVSNISCIPEVCGEENAVFFNPYDIKDMAEKIFTLYKDKNLQEKLIKNGLSHIKNFTWEESAKKTFDEILKNVL